VHQLTDSPEAAFAAIVAAQPARPFVTFYDEKTGERSELSAKSVANWVAKTYFLLIDELGLGVGDRALVALDAHWITVPVLLGSWTAGLSVTRAGTEADIAFVDPAHLGEAAGVTDVFAVDPTAAGRGFGGTEPAGTLDYVGAVRPQPDAWATVRATAGPGDPAIDGQPRRELMAAAQARADALGLAPDARLLTARPWLTTDDWLDTLVVALAVGGSLVILANADEATVARRAQQERAVVID